MAKNDLPWDEFSRLIGLNDAPQPGTAIQEPDIAPVAKPAGVTPGFESIAEPGAEPTGISVLPASEEELRRIEERTEQNRASRPVRVAGSRFATPDIATKLADIATKLGARAGVPFDTVNGLDFAHRRVFELQPTEAEQMKFLENRFGKENVRKNSFGHAIVTKPNEQGVMEDVLVNPIGLDWRDITKVEAAIPEMIGSVVPLIATKGATFAPGILRAIGTLGLSVLGEQAGGAAKDVLTRWAQGDDANMREIAGRRAGNAAMSFFAGGITGAAGFGLSRAITPFGKVGPKQFAARDAQKYFRDKYGVEVPMSAAEATGSPILQRGEAMALQLPGSSAKFEAFRAKQLAQIEELQRIATGTLPDQEAAGKQFLSAAGAKTAQLDFQASRAAQETIDQASREIKNAIGAPIDKVNLGNSIETKAFELRSSFKAQDKANYDALFSHPSAKAFVIDADNVANAIKSVMDEFFPRVERTVTKPSGLLLPSGAPHTITVKEQEILDKQIKPGLQARLQELASLKGGKISLQALKEIRTDIDDAIAVGMAVPGVKEGTLRAAKSKVTDAIQDGLKQIGDPSLDALWKNATKYHADNVGRFERAGIAEIFRDPSQSNYLGPTELVSRATSGKKAQEVYAAYKEFFGPSSTQVRGIQKAVKDDVLKLGNLSPTIDAEGFVRRLEQLDEDAPQVVADVFGSNLAEKLRASGMTIQAVKGKSLPKEEIEKLVASGNPSFEKFTELMAIQAKKDDAFRNKLVKEISAGNVDADRIQPTQVVEKLVFRKDTQPEHLEQLIGQLSDRPEVLEDLRRLTFKRVLDDATVQLKNGDRVLSAGELEKILSDNNTKNRLTKVLGIDHLQDLEQLQRLLAPSEAVQASARAYGGLAAGSQIGGMFRGEWKYLSRAAENLAMAIAYTSKPVRSYLLNTALTAEGKALRVNTAIASVPFISAVSRSLTEEAAREVMFEYKNAVDTMIDQDPASAQAGPTANTGDIPWDDFMRQIGVQP